MIAALRALAPPVAALGGALLLVWAGSGRFEAVSPSEPSVEDVYRRAEQELRRGGGIYQVTITISDDMGLLAYQGSIRRWVDVQRDVSREEADLGPLGASTTLTTREARYVRERDGRITTTSGHLWRCHGAGVAASAVLGCPGPTERSSTTLAYGQHAAGQATLVLVTTGTSSGSDQTLTFTRRLHLDPRSYLPLAFEGEGEIDFGQRRPIRQQHTYTGSFIRADPLPADFFDPASLGYARSDPAKTLDGASDLAVYWLGAHHRGERGLPDLVLSRVDAPPHGPGYRYLLHYARADDRFGPAVVTLQLWPRSAWDAVIRQSQGMNVWDDPCWQRSEMAVADRRAVIISGFASAVVRLPQPSSAAPGQCPSTAPDRFLAQVFVGGSVVLVDAPPVFRAAGMTTSPYNTLDGITVIARGLARRDGRT